LYFVGLKAPVKNLRFFVVLDKKQICWFGWLEKWVVLVCLEWVFKGRLLTCSWREAERVLPGNKSIGTGGH
jgi:hypothetical protein